VQRFPPRTPSLLLRHFVAEDAAPIVVPKAEASTRRWLPSHVCSSLQDAFSALCFLISCYLASDHPQHAPQVLAVELQGTGRLLWHVGFSQLDSSVDVSYAIGEEPRGNGCGTEALAHACQWLA